MIVKLGVISLLKYILRASEHVQLLQNIPISFQHQPLSEDQPVNPAEPLNDNIQTTNSLAKLNTGLFLPWSW